MRSNPSSAIGLRLVSLLLALLLAACQSPASLSFATDGGDAWALHKPLRGTVEGACAQVWLEGPAGSVLAWSDGTRFAGELPLRPGRNQVEAICLEGGEARARVAQEWTQRLADTPVARVRTRATEAGVRLDAGASEPASLDPAPLERFEWRARAGNPAPLRMSGGVEVQAVVEGRRLELEVPRADGEYYVDLEVTDATGRRDRSAAVFRVEGGQAREVDLRREPPAWAEDLIVYGASPYLLGGGFAEVTAHLDRIVELGANAIWLAPAKDVPLGDFGYAVRNHFAVRDDYGGEAQFRRLLTAARARGLRVLLDFVPSHFSERHVYHLDAEVRGTRSPYYDWFARDEAGEITYYFDWQNLKNLDYDNPEVRNHILAAFAYWVREFGIHGFRVDASWAVRERAPEFWPRWREELKRIEPELFLLAEASAREPYHVTHGFDAAYDWTEQLGQWAWHDVFGENGQVDLVRLRAALAHEWASAEGLVFRFISNNDTGARFISRYGVELQRLAATMLFTLPGIPLIYNGDEIGAEFEPYGARPPIDWKHDPHGLTPLYRNLAALRRAQPALRSPELVLLRTGRDEQVFAYARPGPEPLVVLINFDAAPQRVRLPDSTAAVLGTEPQDLLSGRVHRLQPDAPRLRMAGYSALVLASRAPRS
jgi:cyclomaltodextrinase / maltogenic alpha-amylase / neopullulanase